MEYIINRGKFNALIFRRTIDNDKLSKKKNGNNNVMNQQCIKLY